MNKSAMQSSGNNGQLVFSGTIISINNSPIERSNLDWIVSARVDRIISGEFVGKTFDFRIHSPTKSGLEVGKQYIIEATLSQDGYIVDQYQWRK
jgi:hypothetical protein